jgi:SAM-dependent methyltransferase
MVDIAKSRFPDYNFHVWDLEEKFPENKTYDVIVCKLVLMFVDDLKNVAQEFKRLLNPNGVAIISVVHPIYWHTNYLLNHFKIETRPEFEVIDKGYTQKIKKS